MAASLLAKLEREIECELCLESLNDPRELVCRHTYCRSCIDDLLKFDGDGNATIKCPNNCDHETAIGSNDTTKILQKNKKQLNFLDLIKEEKNSHVNNEKAKCHCKSSISKWCISCKVMFCNGCYQTHDCNNKSSINGSYNLVEDCFQPLCDQHDARIKHVCLDCDHRFICCYCLYREHNTHKVDTLDQTANKYKQKYLDDLDKINVDHLDFSYDDVLTNVFKFEEEMVMELNARINLKVSSYIKKLNKEKEEILFQYKQAANNYKQSLNDLQLTHKTVKESLDTAKGYLKQHSAFEALALKVDLDKQMETITKLNVFKVSIDRDENSDALGSLKTAIMKKDLSEENLAFNHDINLESKKNYMDILFESKFLFEDLQKNSKRLFISNDEEKSYLRYNKKDICALISNNDIQTLKKIIFINPKVIARNISCLIYLVIQHNQFNVLDLLLKYYPDAVDVKVDKNNTPLLYAVEKGRTECVKVLLQNNANIQVRYGNNDTCLHHAVINGDQKIINILLNYGADINSKGQYGSTPLMKAAIHGHKECLNILLQHNADVNLKNDYNNISLQFAADYGHPEIINILLTQAADINSKGEQGRTPLINAAKEGHVECVQVLLQNNANIQVRNDYNDTCLHFAAKNGHHEIINILLNHGADINSKGCNGFTPLRYAAARGDKECVNILRKQY